MRIRNAVLTIVSTTALITGLAACGATNQATVAGLVASNNTALHDVQNGNFVSAASFFTGPGAASTVAELALLGPIAQAAAKTEQDITAAEVTVTGNTGIVETSPSTTQNWVYAGGTWKEVVPAS